MLEWALHFRAELLAVLMPQNDRRGVLFGLPLNSVEAPSPLENVARIFIFGNVQRKLHLSVGPNTHQILLFGREGSR